ncbi:hypothetical protein [Treponema sp.]|uniref:hypothetical protein n=1 Tax=Treponema sp. TaxID=166 RepID=UPI003FD724C0
MEETMARKFYTDEEKAKHMALWEASGMTRKKYATSNGKSFLMHYQEKSLCWILMKLRSTVPADMSL